MSDARPRAVAAVAALALAAGVGAHLWWPSSRPSLDCAPDQVHLDAQGVARCGPGSPLPAGAGLSVGSRLDLNRVSAQELALLPGIGPQLAAAIVAERTRQGGFKSWDDLDRVRGVGPARLETLKVSTELR